MDLTYFSPKVEKRPSNVHGRGLFARDPIQRGEIVVVKGGYVMTGTQRPELPEGMRDSEIQVTDDLFIGPTTLQERVGGMMHLNHSCDPNLGLQGQIVFVALRDIERDEELTFDYAMTDDEDYEMACSCGSDRCRGVVTGRDWMRPELKERYRGYFFVVHREEDGWVTKLQAVPLTGSDLEVTKDGSDKSHAYVAASMGRYRYDTACPRIDHTLVASTSNWPFESQLPKPTNHLFSL